jgi:hypothetical protein
VIEAAKSNGYSSKHSRTSKALEKKGIVLKKCNS